MEALFVYQDQCFVWNVSKASENLKKHGVAFEKACEVFFDPFVFIDDASGGDEQRDVAVGFTKDGIVLYVVHLEQKDDSIRIISARSASARERKDYENDI